MEYKKIEKPEINPNITKPDIIGWKFRKTPTPNRGKYCIRFTLNFADKSTKHCQVGGFKTKEDALYAKEEIITSLHQKSYMPFKFTLKEFFDYWLYYYMMDERKIAYSTFMNYRNMIYNHFLKFFPSSKKIHTLETKDIVKFLNSISSDSSRNCAYAVLGSAFKKAEEMHIISRNVAKYSIQITRIENRKHSNKKKRPVFTLKQVLQILLVCKEKQPDFYLLFALSVSNITEGNVLESFYDSIVQYVDGNFVSKWNQIDARLQGGEVDYHRFQNVDGEVAALMKEIDDREQKIAQIDARGNSNEEFELQNKIRTEKISLIMLQSYCQGNTKDLELMLDKEGIIKIWNVIQPILKSLQNTGLWLTHVGVDVGDLDSAVRINRTNDNLKYIITGARNDITLLDRLKVSADFGGDTKELEELKIQEALLTEEMMNNPTTEVLEKWRDVKKKIADFNSAGVGLTDAEIKQFDMDVLSTMSDDQKRKYIEDVLEKALPFINTLFHRLEEVVQELLKSISDQQAAFEEDRQSQELQKQELSKEIADFQQEIGLKYKIRDAVLHKYKATPDNLLEKIAQVYEQAKRQYRTSIERDDWEEIFRGLENWVQDIPDYQQEKDIYLKDFINGCNVVGVSCTENAKTLTENGFDDFDVVIIDEVSKATPPELLIPMLRGRKIVLVGDHRQLPPLFNEHEKTYLEVAEQQEDMEDVIVPLTMEDFNKYKDMVTASLFERYFENANDSIKETLNYQYRMHTDIMDIINIFYDEYLRDGNEDNYTYDTKAHYLSIPSTSGTEMIIPERHAYWFDSSELAGEKIYEQRRQGSSSAENLVEAEMIMEMLKKMELQYANMKGRETPVSIGVISFYYDQVALIRQMLRQESFYAIDVEVNTVDRFQGKEKEIVFVSLVRNVKNFRHSVDSHIAAFQRINVAFSRAQNLLIIVGAKDMYVDQPVKLTDMNDGTEKTIMAYKQIVEMMDQRGTYFTGDEVITDVRAEEILQELKQRQGGNEV